MSEDMPTPSPDVNPETEPFWEATGEGRLLLSECPECDRAIYYPRAYCPDHIDVETEWIEASGEGEVYSYSVVEQSYTQYYEATPFVLAYVELEEGPRIMTQIVEADNDELEVGDPVEVVFHDTDDEDEDYALPRFRPA